jgi:hypothetical protein
MLLGTVILVAKAKHHIDIAKHGKALFIVQADAGCCIATGNDDLCYIDIANIVNGKKLAIVWRI